MSLSSIGAKSIGISRTLAEQNLAKIDPPTIKDENYRYTSIKDLNWDRPAQEQKPQNKLRYLPLQEDEAGLLALGVRRQEIEASKFVFAPLEDSLQLLPIEALKKLDELMRNLPGKMAHDLFANLAAARWSAGTVLYVPPGVKVSKPLRLVHGFDTESDSYFFRNIVIVGKGSEVEFIEECVGGPKGSTEQSLRPLAAGLTQIVVEDGGKLKWTKIQNWGRDVHSFLRQNAEIHVDAQFDVNVVSIGGAKAQQRLEANCLGSGARFSLKAGIRGDQDQHYDYWVSSNHTVPHTSSDMKVWSALGDRSKSVFNGNIVITPGALQTEAYQKNRNLLLSEKATVNSIPKLEIATDDVTCAHGSSTSSVDPNQLYYLQTRGIEKSEAERMIVEGFMEPVLKEISTKALQEGVRKAISEKWETAQ